MKVLLVELEVPTKMRLDITLKDQGAQCIVIHMIFTILYQG